MDQAMVEQVMSKLFSDGFPGHQKLRETIQNVEKKLNQDFHWELEEAKKQFLQILDASIPLGFRTVGDESFKRRDVKYAYAHKIDDHDPRIRLLLQGFRIQPQNGDLTFLVEGFVNEVTEKEMYESVYTFLGVDFPGLRRNGMFAKLGIDPSEKSGRASSSSSGAASSGAASSASSSSSSVSGVQKFQNKYRNEVLQDLNAMENWLSSSSSSSSSPRAIGAAREGFFDYNKVVKDSIQMELREFDMQTFYKTKQGYDVDKEEFYDAERELKRKEYKSNLELPKKEEMSQINYLVRILRISVALRKTKAYLQSMDFLKLIFEVAFRKYSVKLDFNDVCVNAEALKRNIEELEKNKHIAFPAEKKRQIIEQMQNVAENLGLPPEKYTKYPSGFKDWQTARVRKFTLQQPRAVRESKYSSSFDKSSLQARVNILWNCKERISLEDQSEQIVENLYKAFIEHLVRRLKSIKLGTKRQIMSSGRTKLGTKGVIGEQFEGRGLENRLKMLTTASGRKFFCDFLVGDVDFEYDQDEKFRARLKKEIAAKEKIYKRDLKKWQDNEARLKKNPNFTESYSKPEPPSRNEILKEEEAKAEAKQKGFLSLDAGRALQREVEARYNQEYELYNEALKKWKANEAKITEFLRITPKALQRYPEPEKPTQESIVVEAQAKERRKKRLSLQSDSPPSSERLRQEDFQSLEPIFSDLFTFSMFNGILHNRKKKRFWKDAINKAKKTRDHSEIQRILKSPSYAGKPDRTKHDPDQPDYYMKHFKFDHIKDKMGDYFEKAAANFGLSDTITDLLPKTSGVDECGTHFQERVRVLQAGFQLYNTIEERRARLLRWLEDSPVGEAFLLGKYTDGCTSKSAKQFYLENLVRFGGMLVKYLKVFNYSRSAYRGGDAAFCAQILKLLGGDDVVDAVADIDTKLNGLIEELARSHTGSERTGTLTEAVRRETQKREKLILESFQKWYQLEMKKIGGFKDTQKYVDLMAKVTILATAGFYEGNSFDSILSLLLRQLEEEQPILGSEMRLRFTHSDPDKTEHYWMRCPQNTKVEAFSMRRMTTEGNKLCFLDVDQDESLYNHGVHVNIPFGAVFQEKNTTEFADKRFAFRAMQVKSNIERTNLVRRIEQQNEQQTQYLEVSSGYESGKQNNLQAADKVSTDALQGIGWEVVGSHSVNFVGNEWFVCLSNPFGYNKQTTPFTKFKDIPDHKTKLIALMNDFNELFKVGESPMIATTPLNESNRDGAGGSEFEIGTTVKLQTVAGWVNGTILDVNESNKKQLVYSIRLEENSLLRKHRQELYFLENLYANNIGKKTEVKDGKIVKTTEVGDWFERKIEDIYWLLPGYNYAYTLNEFFAVLLRFSQYDSSMFDTKPAAKMLIETSQTIINNMSGPMRARLEDILTSSSRQRQRKLGPEFVQYLTDVIQKDFPESVWRLPFHKRVLLVFLVAEAFGIVGDGAVMNRQRLGQFSSRVHEKRSGLVLALCYKFGSTDWVATTEVISRIRKSTQAKPLDTSRFYSCGDYNGIVELYNDVVELREWGKQIFGLDNSLRALMKFFMKQRITGKVRYKSKTSDGQIIYFYTEDEMNEHIIMNLPKPSKKQLKSVAKTLKSATAAETEHIMEERRQQIFNSKVEEGTSKLSTDSAVKNWLAEKVYTIEIGDDEELDMIRQILNVSIANFKEDYIRERDAEIEEKAAKIRDNGLISDQEGSINAATKDIEDRYDFDFEKLEALSGALYRGEPQQAVVDIASLSKIIRKDLIRLKTKLSKLSDSPSKEQQTNDVTVLQRMRSRGDMDVKALQDLREKYTDLDDNTDSDYDPADFYNSDVDPAEFYDSDDDSDVEMKDVDDEDSEKKSIRLDILKQISALLSLVKPPNPQDIVVQNIGLDDWVLRFQKQIIALLTEFYEGGAMSSASPQHYAETMMEFLQQMTTDNYRDQITSFLRKLEGFQHRRKNELLRAIITYADNLKRGSGITVPTQPFFIAEFEADLPWILLTQPTQPIVTRPNTPFSPSNAATRANTPFTPVPQSRSPTPMRPKTPGTVGFKRVYPESAGSARKKRRTMNEDFELNMNNQVVGAIRDLGELNNVGVYGMRAVQEYQSFISLQYRKFATAGEFKTLMDQFLPYVKQICENTRGKFQFTTNVDNMDWTQCQQTFLGKSDLYSDFCFNLENIARRISDYQIVNEARGLLEQILFEVERDLTTEQGWQTGETAVNKSVSKISQRLSQGLGDIGGEWLDELIRIDDFLAFLTRLCFNQAKNSYNHEEALEKTVQTARRSDIYGKKIIYLLKLLLQP